MVEQGNTYYIAHGRIKGESRSCSRKNIVNIIYNINTSGIFSPETEMVIIPKREKEIAAQSKREELMNIPSAGTEHNKTRKMGGGGRKPSKLVIYIINIHIYFYICL